MNFSTILDPTQRLWTLEQATSNTPDLDVLSDEFETVWLPILGPSVTVLTRRLARLVKEHGTVRVEPCDLAWDLGLSGQSGNSTFLKAFARAERFNMIEASDPGTIGVHFVVPYPRPDERRRLFLKQQWFQKAAS